MIKSRINKLTTEQQRQLYYAFEHEMSQHIKLPDNKFIGVNIKPSKQHTIIESAGAWSYGEFKND